MYTVKYARRLNAKRSGLDLVFFCERASERAPLGGRRLPIDSQKVQSDEVSIQLNGGTCALARGQSPALQISRIIRGCENNSLQVIVTRATARRVGHKSKYVSKLRFRSRCIDAKFYLTKARSFLYICRVFHLWISRFTRDRVFLVFFPRVYETLANFAALEKKTFVLLRQKVFAKVHKNVVIYASEEQHWHRVVRNSVKL